MKKALYIFLSSLLGMLLFLILHRLLVFACLLAVNADPWVFGNLADLEILALDFVSLIIVILLGSWYGIALGLKWYEAIYEKGEHGGFVDHLVKTWWPSPERHYNLKDKIESLTRELKEDVLEFEHLAKAIKPVIRKMTPIRRRIVRRRPSPVKKTD